MFKNIKQTCPDHKFETNLAHATGYWQKRDCPGDGIYVPGTLQMCRACGALRIKPDDPSLRTVECTR